MDVPYVSVTKNLVEGYKSKLSLSIHRYVLLYVSLNINMNYTTAESRQSQLILGLFHFQRLTGGGDLNVIFVM